MISWSDLPSGGIILEYEGALYQVEVEDGDNILEGGFVVGEK